MNDRETPDAGAPANRLAREASPYLRQHAHNPVNWYPWGEAAFAKARRESKPIFLSVGYSTCHWCHVMAHESFENPQVARFLNQHFVSVKVDREERPDLDRLYMAYVQGVTRGGGGWPMSVWLTPELKPFYGGTYFPPEDAYGRPGFARVLESLAEAWRTARPQLEAAGAEAVQRLQAFAASAVPAPVDGAVLDAAAKAFAASYDSVRGGFGRAPKFPRPSVFSFLLRHFTRTGEQRCLEMALQTLGALADGGIHDHLGGGFHRYTTDAAWLVPHFEKMLYDQAQLAFAYLEAYQVSGDAFFAEVARDILRYVRRELTGPEGEFFSAEDADSPAPGGEVAEGAFYTWTDEELKAALETRDAAAFGAAFGLDRFDNLVDGRHVLAVSHDGARELLESCQRALLAARNRRPRPHRDDQALTAWNGLMISAFARAWQVLGERADLSAAQRAAAFAVRRLIDPASGRLLRRFCGGAASTAGYAEDYACLIQGFLDLYEADFDTAHLEQARRLQDQMDADFWDEASGGYYSSAAGAPDVLVRMKELYDGAEPSANSVAALNLVRLHAITGSEQALRKAEAIFKLAGARLRESPESLPQMLAALEAFGVPPRQIVIAGERDADDTRALLRAVRRPLALRQTVLLADGGRGQVALMRYQPAIGAMRPVGDHATAYVCSDFVCREPVTTAEALSEILCGKGLAEKDATL